VTYWPREGRALTAGDDGVVLIRADALTRHEGRRVRLRSGDEELRWLSGTVAHHRTIGTSTMTPASRQVDCKAFKSWMSSLGNRPQFVADKALLVPDGHLGL
jgi:hypothetical protein